MLSFETNACQYDNNRSSMVIILRFVTEINPSQRITGKTEEMHF